ncbi:MAG: rRNA maturation RNase YbeY [Betaproteobacteria bacterium TMED82]|nr:MAG: rRNA maturation RNase YbeY [Betaproteobacteria bacterium TMED82]
MRRLNFAFRKRDKVTNILTFCYESYPNISADLVLCVPFINAESRCRRLPKGDHFSHLIVHGTLHAAGFNHEASKDAKIMEKMEVDVLECFQILNPYQ